MGADWLICPMYHDMRHAHRKSFEQQIKFMRSLGDFISLDDAVRLLDRTRLGGRYFCMTFDDGYCGAYTHAHPILAEAAVPSAFFVVPHWVDEAARSTGTSANKYINWAMCRELSDRGVVIGSHTLEHARLTGLCAIGARSQMEASKRRIEAELARPCEHFACPWGQPHVDYIPDRDPSIARSAGYKSFLTTIRGRAGGGANPFELPRIRLEPDWSIPELKYMFGRA